MNEDSSEHRQYNRELRGMAKGTIIGLAASVVNKLISFASTMLLTRALGPEGYGLFGLGRTLTTMAAQLGLIGLPHAVVRFVSIADTEGDGDKSRRILGTCTLVGLVANIAAAGLIIIFARTLATDVFNKPELTPLLVVMACCMPFFSTTIIWASGPIARRSVNAQALSGLGRNVILLVGVALLPLLFAPTALAMSWSWLIACVGGFVIVVPGLRHAFPQFTWTDMGLHSVKPLLAFSLPVLLVVVTDIGLYRINVLLGGIWLTKADLGLYTLSVAIAELVIFGVGAVRKIFRPTVAAFHKQGKIEELGNAFQASVRWGLYFTMPVSLIIIMKGASVLTLFGEGFAAGLPVLFILCVSQVISASVAPAGMVLVMSGKQLNYTAIGILAVLVNLGACFLLVPSYGMVGLAIAASVSRVGRDLSAMAMAWLFYRVNPYHLRVMKPAIASLIAAPVLLLSLSNLVLDVVLIGTVYTITFVLICWLIGIEQEDRDIIEALRKRLLVNRQAPPSAAD